MAKTALLVCFLLFSSEADAPYSTGHIAHELGGCLTMPTGAAFCAYVPPRP